jgi:hypothetical protein
MKMTLGHTTIDVHPDAEHGTLVVLSMDDATRLSVAAMAPEYAIALAFALREAAEDALRAAG